MDLKGLRKKLEKRCKKVLTERKGRGIIYKLTRERRTHRARKKANSTLKNEQQAKRKNVGSAEMHGTQTLENFLSISKKLDVQFANKSETSKGNFAGRSFGND